MIKDKLQQGSVLLMDDWDQFCADNSKGQRKALKEFLEKNNHIHVEDYIIYSFLGKAFIVHFDDYCSPQLPSSRHNGNCYHRLSYDHTLLYASI